MKTLKITTFWTPDEAVRIYETLELLQNAVRETYGSDITAFYQEVAQVQTEHKSRFNDDEDF